jgi:hypothetical protein
MVITVGSQGDNVEPKECLLCDNLIVTWLIYTRQFVSRRLVAIGKAALFSRPHKSQPFARLVRHELYEKRLEFC